MFTRSIRWRLQLWQSFLLVCILSGFGATAYQLHRINVISQVDGELQRRVAALVSDIRLHGPAGWGRGRPPFEEGRDGPPPRHGGPGFGPGPGPDFGPEFAPDFGPGGPGRDRGPRGRGGWLEDLFEARDYKLSNRALALFEGSGTNDFYFAIWSRNGLPLNRSTNAPAGLGRPSPAASMTGIHARTADGRREAYQFTGLGECVVAGRSMTSDLTALRRFAWGLVAVGGAVLALGLGGGWILAGRALRPVEDISTAATRISAGRLSERIDVTETESELGRLAGVLNATFARLETAFAQQQQFTADASHELRTPIAVIIAEAQTALARERTAAEYRGSVEVCLEAAQQMRRLARSLLELARYDAGEEQIERQPLDLAETVRGCVELLQPLARERAVTIRTDFGPAPILGDADRLTQVATNLLTNALTYNRPGGEVRVTTRLEPSAAVLEVTDTGIGIAPEDQPHVFERFYRADKSRARNEGHHGLGLAICRAVVEAHNGTITLRSEPGVGTTFTVRLPGAG